MEQWKDIPGYDGLYRVSNIGKIYSNYSHKVLRPSISSQGYEQCVLYKGGIKSIMPVHRAVALAFIPREDDSLVVNHIDENKRNNVVENLEWVTRRENNLYGGAHCIEASKEKMSKVFYLYDANLNFIGSEIGIRKYALEHGLSCGNISSVIKANAERSERFRSYKGIVYLNRKI